MRIVAEPLANSNRLLVRLLGSDIAYGSYKIDATPAIREVVAFEVVAGMVRQEEVRLYLTGFAKDPEQIKVTTPDNSVVFVQVGQVELPKEEPYTIEQPTETIEKEEKQVFQQPLPSQIETVQPPELPRQWFELHLERSSPLVLGNYVTSGPIVYQGGCLGRALSSAIAQTGANEAPYKQGISPRIEGQWSNTLQNSNLAIVETRSGFLDKVPQGWYLDLTNSSDLLRVVTTEGKPLPSLQLTWRVSDMTGLSVLPRLSIVTPPVSAGRTLQFIASPSAKNDRGGYLRLQSSSMAYSAQFSLEPGVPTVVRFDVLDDPGPVTVRWHQRSTDYTNQELSIVGPMASDYGSPHSFAPTGSTSQADLVEVNDIVYQDRRWPLNQGCIRVDSDVETINQPISWDIYFADDGSRFLALENGILWSTFASTPLTLAPYLAETINEAGNYKIKWSGDEFKIVTRSNPQGTELPFSLDLTIPEARRTSPLCLRISSFHSGVGSGMIRYFGFLPK